MVTDKEQQNKVIFMQHEKNWSLTLNRHLKQRHPNYVLWAISFNSGLALLLMSAWKKKIIMILIVITIIIHIKCPCSPRMKSALPVLLVHIFFSVTCPENVPRSTMVKTTSGTSCYSWPGEKWQNNSNKQTILTRTVSGFSQSGHKTNFSMKPSSISCSLSASCDPLTM